MSCSGSATSAGSSGCNTFAGTYGTNGNVVRVGALATTQMACSDDVMTQETAFLAALQGAALIDAAGVDGEPHRPQRQHPRRPGPPSRGRGRERERPCRRAEPTAKPTEKPTEKPTAKPTEKPTEKPTPTPSPTPKPTATPAPTPTAPAITASCPLKTADDVKVAKITYPASWYTVTSPADLACQYFDPSPITVPSDPDTLVTTIMATSSATSYNDAVEAATDASSWDVTQQQELTLDGLDATLVAATSTADSAGIPPGTSQFAYLVDVGSSGTVIDVDDGHGEHDRVLPGIGRAGPHGPSSRSSSPAS